jgi:hypothetical protein
LAASPDTGVDGAAGLARHCDRKEGYFAIQLFLKLIPAQPRIRTSAIEGRGHQ